MAYNFQYKVFVSSPGDVEKERKTVDDVISKINDAVSDSLGIYLTVVRWEKMPPETTDEELQIRLNNIIKECHFFLLILNKRYGTVMRGQTISNTEREINTIIDHLSKDKKKKILSYFKKNHQDSDPGPQLQKIMDLKQRLRESGLWFYKEFETKNEFEITLTHDLYQILIKMKQASFKVEQLKRFWQFGKLDNQDSPKVLVIYPPVPREWMGMTDFVNLWERRLLPSIFFEDFKALHKILKNLSMVGLSDYKVYSKFDTPPDYDKSNIIWICLPRQTKGLKTLQNRKEKKFEIIPREKKKEPYIRWKGQDGKWFDVNSPLLSYLKEQRKEANVVGEWDRTLGNIIAKDYAVIACFERDIPYNKTPGMEKLKEFYLTGIHGLGTWGAAWYIDRFYGKFSEMSIDELQSVQMLIEVEYRDGRISNVRDVSELSKEYFVEQQKLKTVRNVINEYKDLL